MRAVLEIITHFEDRYEEFQLAESLIAHDEYFSLWRLHHVKMVERMVGTKRGTGGSEGVGYLRTTLDKRFFPELWEARTFSTPNTARKAVRFQERAARHNIAQKNFIPSPPILHLSYTYEDRIP
jgi:hypothetical protein